MKCTCLAQFSGDPFAPHGSMCDAASTAGKLPADFETVKYPTPPVPKFDKEAETLGAGRKYDANKLRFSLIPPAVTTSLAKVLTYGAQKYAPNNWQNVQPFRERYSDALLRHLEAWRAGEDVDPESGCLHLEHVLCNAAFLCWDAVVRPGRPRNGDNSVPPAGV